MTLTYTRLKKSARETIYEAFSQCRNIGRTEWGGCGLVVVQLGNGPRTQRVKKVMVNIGNEECVSERGYKRDTEMEIEMKSPAVATHFYIVGYKSRNQIAGVWK